MKKILLLTLFTILSLTSFSQKRDSVFVKTDVFEVMYSEKLEGPLWVKYKVECATGEESRKGMDFYKNDSIHTSDNNDYVNNIYDKGHMAPAAAFNCDAKKLKATFSYLNCSLQDQYLNRGTWRLLEAWERKLAAENDVFVEIYPKYSENSTVLKTGATVPDGYLKIIKTKDKTYKFWFENKRPETSDYMKYLID
jgi:endonuclease G